MSVDRVPSAEGVDRDDPPVSRWVWSEHAAPRELASPRVAALCRRFGVGLIAALRPWHLADIEGLLGWARDEGVAMSLWPMVADRDGRWLSIASVEPFRVFSRGLVDRIERAAAKGAAPRELALDLEPPFSQVERLARGGRSALRAALEMGRASEAARAAGERAYIEHVASTTRALAACGTNVSAAIVPLALFDPPARDAQACAGFQRLLGTPVDALTPHVTHVSAMAYSTLLGAALRPFAARSHAIELVESIGRAAAARYGARAGLSLGAVGVGALSSEPVYASPRELREDCAAAARAGVRRLALFEWAGVLARGPEAWLAAFTEPADVIARVETPLSSRRAKWITAALRAAATVPLARGA